MTAVARLRWLAVVLAGLCVMALAPGAAGHAAVRGGQAGHDPVAAVSVGPASPAVPAGPVPPAALGFLSRIGCFSAADCVAVGYSIAEFYNDLGVHSVAEHWNGRTWTPLPSPGRQVAGLACPRARLCQAVGGESAERWNGRAWIAEKTPAVRGASLTGVACPAASACVAVGTRSNGRPPVAETWNGSAWAAHNLVNPAGAVQASLSSVSCTGRSSCIAVGSYQSAAGQATLAEKWNGRRWTMLAMPPTASKPADLTSVSCASATNCVAVGSDDFQPLAESWNGTTWTVTPAPPAATTVVSCAAASCVAIGNLTVQPSAMSWNGSSWKLLSLQPSTPATLTLSGVSCPAATRCMAVGGSNDGSFAMSWDGSAWRSLRVDRADELSSISCTRATRCMATGSFETASGKIVALTESWNGSSWHRKPASQAAESVLSDVSCGSAARCVAVGAIGISATLAEAWNGTTWRVTSGAGIPGQFPTGLASVSCHGVTCLALDDFGEAWAWDGAAWHQMPSAGVSADVSCANPSYCMATGTGVVGDPGQGQFVSVAELWNGQNWKQLHPPGTGFNAVSCTSTSFCMAAGGNIAAIWNGTTWRMRKLPGSFGIAMSGDTVVSRGITGLSCVSRSACMAVGNYLAKVGSRYEGFNVAAFWNGTRWRRLLTPGPGGGLADVSCTSAPRCMAVGLRPADPAGTRLLVERWNGKRWFQMALPNP